MKEGSFYPPGSLFVNLCLPPGGTAARFDAPPQRQERRPEVTLRGRLNLTAGNNYLSTTLGFLRAYRNRPEEVEFVEHLAGAKHDCRKRVFGDYHRQTGLFA